MTDGDLEPLWAPLLCCGSHGLGELKFMFSKKATKIDEIFTIHLLHNVKSSNFVAFLENVSFTCQEKFVFINPSLISTLMDVHVLA